MFSPVCMPLWRCQILELQTVLSCRVGAGNPGSSGRAVNILNHWAISSAPKYLTFNILRLLSVLPHDDDCKNYPYLLETLELSWHCTLPVKATLTQFFTFVCVPVRVMVSMSQWWPPGLLSWVRFLLFGTGFSSYKSDSFLSQRKRELVSPEMTFLIVI